MYSEFAKQQFEKFQGSDYDYLVIVKNDTSFLEHWNCIPRIDPNFKFETIDQAIEWHFKEGYITCEIYDLYADWHKSMIRNVVRSSDHQIIDIPL